MTKVCSRCGKSYPIHEFRLIKGNHRTSHCKACAREYLAEWRGRNAERIRIERSDRHSNMTAEQREAKRRKDREAYARNVEAQRDARLRADFGISLVEYQQILDRQNGRCAICGQTCGSGRNLAVDHDHETGLVRGLLCMNCNNGLGRFKDRADLLRNALRYLGDSIPLEKEDE